MTDDSRPPTLHELDRATDLEGGTPENPYRSRAPADFERMNAEQKRGWPRRAALRWMRRRTALLAVPIALGAIVFAILHRVGTGLGAAGLGFDILGVYWLAESLLVDELEANWLTTFGAIGSRGLLALRDAIQVRFAIAVAVAGFILQLANTVLTV